MGGGSLGRIAGGTVPVKSVRIRAARLGEWLTDPITPARLPKPFRPSTSARFPGDGVLHASQAVER
jgi:hypothetical protein